MAVKVTLRMNRSKLIAIVTGAISLIIATAYLMLVQLLDFRGEMIPAPISSIVPSTPIVGENTNSAIAFEFSIERNLPIDRNG